MVQHELDSCHSEFNIKLNFRMKLVQFLGCVGTPDGVTALASAAHRGFDELLTYHVYLAMPLDVSALDFLGTKLSESG
jgi:hypothetical protein